MTHEVPRLSFSPYKSPTAGYQMAHGRAVPHTLNQDMGLRHTDRVHFISSLPTCGKGPYPRLSNASTPSSNGP